MKYEKVGFREVFRKFCLFDMTDTFRKAMKDFPGTKEADAVLTYGYIDHEAGVTLEILCACKKAKKDEDIQLAPGNDDVRSFIRIGAVKDVKFKHVDDRIGKRFAKKMKTLCHYDNDGFGVRHMTIFDHLRHEYNVDDMQVVLRKKDDSAKEIVWVRVDGLTEMFYYGELLNEPVADFGYHKGDMVCFRVADEKGIPTAYLDERSYQNDYERVLEESDDYDEDMTDEESDEIIEEMIYDYAITQYFRDRSEENYDLMIDFLLSHQVYVPILAEFGPEDRKRIEEVIEDNNADVDSLKEALDFVDRDNITLKPDILERDEDMAFFPCFTSEDAMEKYEDHYARIPVQFTDAIELALNYPERILSGIVVNAFTTPVEISVEQLRKISRSWR